MTSEPEAPDNGQPEHPYAYLTDPEPEDVLYVPLKGNWRQAAARHLARLDLADAVEAKALHELCMALRDGLTPEQQRTVAQDLLGEPHVAMLVDLRTAAPGTVVPAGAHGIRILVPASSARQIVGGGRHLLPARGDPWWKE